MCVSVRHPSFVKAKFKIKMVIRVFTKLRGKIMRSMLQLTGKEFKYAQLSKPGGRLVLATWALVNMVVVATMFNSALQGHWNNVFTCFKVIILCLTPWVLERKFKIEVSSTLFITVQLFIFASIILGEIQTFYLRFPLWDNMLHTINGFLFSAIGFVLISTICKKSQYNIFSIKPIYLVLMAFCFSMTIGVVWEFYEFIMDVFFQRDMQKDTIIHTIKSMAVDETAYSLTVFDSITNVTVNGQDLELGGYLDIGLYDTMSDLFSNCAGAFLFGFIKYFGTRKNKDLTYSY